ncbi:MAG: hypothetical protein Q9201_001636 [Fulgogasparrea decipioides]
MKNVVVRDYMKNVRVPHYLFRKSSHKNLDEANMLGKKGQASHTSITSSSRHLDKAHTEPTSSPTGTDSTPAGGNDTSDQGTARDGCEAAIEAVIDEDGVVTEEMPVDFPVSNGSCISGSDTSEHASSSTARSEDKGMATKCQSPNNVTLSEAQAVYTLGLGDKHSNQGRCLFQDHSRPSLFSIKSLIESSDTMEYEDFVNLHKKDQGRSCSTLSGSSSAQYVCGRPVQMAAAARKPMIVDGIVDDISCVAEFDWVEPGDEMSHDALGEWDKDALPPFNRLE